MIKKIKKIQNLGIFSDFSWDANALTDFKRYNIFYGWNGSGKTTFSKLFSSFEFGLIEEFPDLAFLLDTDLGEFRQGNNYPQKVRIFNQDYVSNNIQILQGSAKPIYILGEENKKIADEIALDTTELLEREKELKRISKEKDTLESNIGKMFTDIARTISSNTSGEATRRYNKRDAENSFSNLVSKTVLDESILSKYRLTLTQIIKPEISKISGHFNLFSAMLKTTQELCKNTIESIVIERFKKHSDISEWVEQGIEIHEAHSSQQCEFCGNQLTRDRLSQLARHFNKADKQLKNDIDQLLSKLNEFGTHLEETSPVDKANLYEEMQDAFNSVCLQFQIQKESLKSKISELEQILKNKKAKTTESVSFTFEVDINSIQAAMCNAPS